MPAAAVQRPSVEQAPATIVTPVAEPEIAQHPEACTDFYAFACRDWTADDVPDGETRWSLRHHTQRIADEAAVAWLTAPARDDAPARFMRACMAPPSGDAVELGPLAGLRERIDRSDDAVSFVRLAGELHRFDARGIFELRAEPDWSASGRVVAVLAAREATELPSPGAVVDALVASGWSRARAERIAPRVIAFERRITIAGEASPTERSEQRRRAPLFDAYADGMQVPSRTNLRFTHGDRLPALSATIRRADADTRRGWLRWQVWSSLADDLRPNPIASSPAQRAATARWCVARAGMLFEEILGRDLGEHLIDPKRRGDVRQLAARMRSGMQELLASTTWLDDELRAMAMDRVHSLDVHIAWVDGVPDTAVLPELDPRHHVVNVVRAAAWRLDRDLAGADAPIDDRRWSVDQFYIGRAHHDPFLRAVRLPTVIMIDPVFDPYAPARERYGRLGAIIAHEMAHAALTPIVHDEEISIDMAILDARAPIDACLGSDALPIEEVWADLLGLQTAWVAWRRDTDERDDAAAAQDFFTAYAQFFCTALADTADAREIESDARTRARINAAMGHAPAFAEAFGCPAEAPMYATDACDPW